MGENGDGKTILLQAILLALKKLYIKNVSNKANVGRILQYIADNPGLNIQATTTDKKKYLCEPEKALFVNIYAYGYHRNRSNASQYVDQEGYLTLFYDNKELLSPIEWLKDVKLDEGRSFVTFDLAKQLLQDLLDNHVEIEMHGSEVHFIDIRFTEKNTPQLKFEQFSDGYKSVMTWVVDLVARLLKVQPHASKTQDFIGIVLVDEIGLHLHPKWEMNIVQKLRNWFPKIQFFFTTHSPTLILNASEDAIFYRVYKEDGVTKISDKFSCKELSDLRLNSLVTSPLFGLDEATMRSFNPDEDDLDTAENFHTNRIRKLVKEEVAKLKESGNNYISPKVLDNIIKKVIKQNQKSND